MESRVSGAARVRTLPCNYPETCDPWPRLRLAGKVLLGGAGGWPVAACKCSPRRVPLARGRPGRVAPRRESRREARRRAGGHPQPAASLILACRGGGHACSHVLHQVPLRRPSDSVVGGAVRSTLDSALRWPRTGVAKPKAACTRILMVTAILVFSVHHTC
jgi:hypothetical protein